MSQPESSSSYPELDHLEVKHERKKAQLALENLKENLNNQLDLTTQEFTEFCRLIRSKEIENMTDEEINSYLKIRRKSVCK